MFQNYGRLREKEEKKRAPVVVWLGGDDFGLVVGRLFHRGSVQLQARLHWLRCCGGLSRRGEGGFELRWGLAWAGTGDFAPLLVVEF